MFAVHRLGSGRASVSQRESLTLFRSSDERTVLNNWSNEDNYPAGFICVRMNPGVIHKEGQRYSRCQDSQWQVKSPTSPSRIISTTCKTPLWGSKPQGPPLLPT